MRLISKAFVALVILLLACDAYAASVRVKDLARIEGLRDNALIGYGIVVGLAGTGDSQRNKATVQSVTNALRQFGVLVSDAQIRSRNVAAVMVTAQLPPYSHRGDKIDINVASMGDARSLVGGTLLLTPLKAVNQKIYALAQGPLSVGGYRYDGFGNLAQQNHPTVGLVPNGAMVEKDTYDQIVSKAGSLYLLLNNPDFTTAKRIVSALGSKLGDERVWGGDIRAVDAGRIAIRLHATERYSLVSFVAQIENLLVTPGVATRVVINERTGTVVAGGDVVIGAVSVTHGDLRLSVSTDYTASQPGFLVDPSDSIATAVLPDTEIVVTEENSGAVSFKGGTNVADLVSTLNKIKLGPRDVISVLQGIKRAGALHAELVIQ